MAEVQREVEEVLREEEVHPEEARVALAVQEGLAVDLEEAASVAEAGVLQEGVDEGRIDLLSCL